MKEKNSDLVARLVLHNLYGITLEQYEQVLKSQNGKCAVCGVVQTKGRLNVDYNYKENKINGLLCEKCFNIIYQIGKNPELLEKAALYLRGHYATSTSQVEGR